MKPQLIFDGDCQFCLRWVLRWQAITGDQIYYLPYQQVAEQFPQITDAEFKESIKLIDSDGTIYSGAEAAFRALSVSPKFKWLSEAYKRIPLFKPVSELVYRLVARNRRLFSKLMGPCCLDKPQMKSVRWLFVRAMGVIYLLAFISIWTQILPLFGHDGILPAHDFLKAISDKVGWSRFYLLPTIFWINSSDLFLTFVCAGGVLGSILLILGIWSGPAAFMLWLFYLSIANIGREFLAFQWDVLLIEAGLLTIFLSPFKSSDKLSESPEPRKLVVWLLRFLLFRLMFFSGFVKLASGDLAWRDLSALAYHYETQPLPTWVAWYMFQLPLWFQKLSTIVMFAVELIVPFFIFAPRFWRLCAYSTLIIFQILIILTGNYCFFNLLTIVLCCMLLDDQALPSELRGVSPLAPKENAAEPSNWRQRVISLLLIVLLIVPVTHSMDRLFRRPAFLQPIRFLSEWISPFRLVNGYGLFAVMTVQRPEIIVEGSDDGKTWLGYEFKFKPGDVMQRPRFNAPHQPRLDWQMWFAALGNFQNNRWFILFSKKILENSKTVISLMEKNPFPQKPPKYLRAVLYEYHFTDFKTRKATGAWWTRELKGLYAPTVSLQVEEN